MIFFASGRSIQRPKCALLTRSSRMAPAMTTQRLLRTIPVANQPSAEAIRTSMGLADHCPGFIHHADSTVRHVGLWPRIRMAYAQLIGTLQPC